MSKLIDFLTFKDKSPAQAAERPRDDAHQRREERDAAVLSGKYSVALADIESISEYRLSSLLQYPHY